MTMILPNDDLQIVPISDDADRHLESLSAAGELHRSLRPNLPDDYQAYMRRMFAEGAEMVVATVNGVAKLLAVYRCHHTTFHGLRFYVDDLVTVEGDRGKGYGNFLLSWCEKRARERGCDFFDLESGVHGYVLEKSKGDGQNSD